MNPLLASILSLASFGASASMPDGVAMTRGRGGKRRKTAPAQARKRALRNKVRRKIARASRQRNRL